jgi:4-hydroxy-tetrahydrodipicolinate synthase
LERRDDQQAYKISTLVASLISLQTSLDAFIAVEKHLLVKQKIFRNQIVRGPTGYTLDDETRSEVDRLFARLTEVVSLGD